MLKREAIKRIQEDGHLILTGDELLSDLEDALKYLRQGHVCRGGNVTTFTGSSRSSGPDSSSSKYRNAASVRKDEGGHY